MIPREENKPSTELQKPLWISFDGWQSPEKSWVMLDREENDPQLTGRVFHKVNNVPIQFCKEECRAKDLSMVLGLVLYDFPSWSVDDGVRALMAFRFEMKFTKLFLPRAHFWTNFEWGGLFRPTLKRVYIGQSQVMLELPSSRLSPLFLYLPCLLPSSLQ